MLKYQQSKNRLPSIDELKWSTFIAIVHLLDVIFGKQSRYLYLLDTFMEKQIRLPPVGAYVLECISIVLSQAEKNGIQAREHCAESLPFL